MLKLEPIIYDEKLTAFDLRDQLDLFTTRLVLDDYDWMTYKLIAWLPTKAYGDVKIKFKYMGASPCKMVVKTENEVHEYSFDYKVFEKHITIFAAAFIENWKSKYAFRPIKEVVEFYNAVLTDPKTVEEKHKRRCSRRGL